MLETDRLVLEQTDSVSSVLNDSCDDDTKLCRTFLMYDAMTLQDGGDGAIVLNMEDHEEIPKAVVKPP